MKRPDPYELPETPLRPDKAWRVIEPYWREMLQLFREHGFEAPGNVAKIVIDPEWRDTCRHFAGMSEDASTLVLAPEFADLPLANIKAILAHEAGHAVDLSSPGKYWFRRAVEMHIRQGAWARSLEDLPQKFQGPAVFVFETLPSHNFAKHLRDWEGRPRDEVEMLADAIAEHVLGERIGYTGTEGCIIQTLGRGIPRPKGLR
jgi:hypothetical protein